jgi:two-component system, chemotaxis family, chemotaxis protein CheY
MRAMFQSTRMPRAPQIRVQPAKISHLTALVADPKLESRKQTARQIAHLGIKTVHECSVDSHLPDQIDLLAPDVLITDWSSETVKLVAAMRRIRNPLFSRNEIPVIAIAPALTATGARALLATGVTSIVMRPLSPAALFGYLCQAVMEKRPFVKTDDYFGPEHPGMIEDPAAFMRSLRKLDEPPQRAIKAA